MKLLFTSFHLSDLVSTQAKLAIPERTLQEDEVLKCTAECEEPLVEALVEVFNGLDDDAQQTVLTATGLSADTIGEAEPAILVFSLQNEEGFCSEAVNGNLHRLGSCLAGCTAKGASCDDFGQAEIDAAEQALNFGCEDAVGFCDGLNVVAEEVRSGVNQGLGVAAMGTALLGALAFHN
eukprot:augustus_masked-scaffold_13-processed-gene-0.2-mRNA-1 protein AED:0.26 eAED:0.26 QI:42/0/0.5/1/0/0.5/2/73/178